MITATANRNGTVDLVGKQGTTWLFYIEVFSDSAKTIPVNLTDYQARGQFRKAYTSATALIRYTCTIMPTHITSNPGTNKIMVSATASQSSAIKVGMGLVGVHDFEIYKGAEVERVMEGKMTVTPEVTK